MKKLIATGEILKNATVSIVGSVYVNIKDDGTEDTAPKSYYVTLNLTAIENSMPDNAFLFDDIEAFGDLKIPGFDGHADVTVSAPVEISYSKTKAFEIAGGKAQVNTVIRYVY